MRNAPDTAVARFRDDVAAVRPFLADTSRLIIVAVSGGADSLALLLLAHAAFPTRVLAITIDHGLRAESHAEAERVAAICAERGVHHRILGGPVPDRAGPTANLSARARALRYARLERAREVVDGDCIMTAHHADDQLETLIMRLNRASGLSGLAGIRAVNGNVVRPLLTWRHDDLVEIVAACGLSAIDDPSNRDDRFDRARLRAELAKTKLFDPVAVARSIAVLAEADAALDAIVADKLDLLWDGSTDNVEIDIRDLPSEILRRLVMRIARQLDPTAAPRRSAIERISRLEQGERVMLGNVIVACGKVAIDASGEAFWPVYRIFRAPPRRS